MPIEESLKKSCGKNSSDQIEEKDSVRAYQAKGQFW
jgi:hypothetical protein